MAKTRLRSALISSRTQREVLGGNKHWILSVPLVALVLALNFGQILAANELSSWCEELGALETEQARLEKENQALVNDLSRISSLSSIEEKAYQLGMVKATAGGIDYLSADTLAVR